MSKLFTPHQCNFIMQCVVSYLYRNPVYVHVYVDVRITSMAYTGMSHLSKKMNISIYGHICLTKFMYHVYDRSINSYVSDLYVWHIFKWTLLLHIYCMYVCCIEISATNDTTQNAYFFRYVSIYLVIKMKNIPSRHY